MPDALTVADTDQVVEVLRNAGLGPLATRFLLAQQDPIVKAIERMERHLVDRLDRLTESVDRLHDDRLRAHTEDAPIPPEADSTVEVTEVAARLTFGLALIDYLERRGRAVAVVWLLTVAMVTGGAVVSLEVAGWFRPAVDAAVEVVAPHVPAPRSQIGVSEAE